ncbi:hypothetical protein CPT_Seuss48 [Caulobacter phage Seuss]|uniref:Uncharacterized protein n=1 Tax=Caulobacter phage Seuss TaxID=1675601 RepID=A0A0K1LM86_9CAUD|nr:hypothetical protein HOR08_gp048 [Caulobacter phage Seuss]AKU43574.1 hypothetical protein CPT_Seuss48 [Caulobacter phage Seuss]
MRLRPQFIASVLTPKRGEGDPIAALFANGSPGLDYDFSKTDRLFQDSSGVTAVTLLDDPIGLALDSDQWAGRTLAQQIASMPGMLANPTFVGGLAGWFEGNPSVAWQADGRVLLTRVGQNAVLRQVVPVVAGRTYRLAASALRTVGTGNMVALVRDTANVALSTVLNFNTSAAEQATYWTATFTGDVRICLERTTTDGQGEAYSASFKEVVTSPAVQATANFKPRFQPDGAKFDAVDDRLVSNYTPPNTTTAPSCMIARVTVPTTLAASQMIAGSFNGTSQRFFLSVGSDGRMRAGGGTENLPFGSDIRGQSVVMGMSFDATTFRVFLNDSELYSGSPSGSVSPLHPLYVGCFNSNGSAGGFWGGHIKRLLVAQKSLELPQFLAIRNRLLSGA